MIPMSTQRVGALVIGQAPRPDLVDPLQALLPDWEIVQAGALDDISAENLPPTNAVYPLMTRMRTGETVIVEEAFLEKRLQSAVAHLESANVAAAILLCAGTFAAVQSNVPLIKPFDVGRAVFQQRQFERLGFITPVAGQVEPIRARWSAAGFRPKVWTAPLDQQDSAFTAQLQAHIASDNLSAIVLDYVGHPTQHVQQLQRHSPVPVFDLGVLAMHALKTAL